MLGGRSKDPERWTLLESPRLGENLSGAIAAIERFGVLVTLDHGPAHPIFPRVGFVTLKGLSASRICRACEARPIASCRLATNSRSSSARSNGSVGGYDFGERLRSGMLA